MKKYYPLLLCVAALVTAFVGIILYEQDYLFRAQELNLFLYAPLFFKQQMVVAGGMLTYLGTYFTQYFYHPWLGALILCTWAALLMWLVKRTFNVPAWWAPILLVPLACVLIIDFNLGYYLFTLKLRGHFFIPVIGLTMGVASVWGFRRMPATKGLRMVYMAVAAIVLYPLAGFYGLLAIALMGLLTWRLTDTKRIQQILTTLLAIILVVFVPLIYYRQVYYQARVDNVWWQALPLYNVEGGFSAYHWPYLIAALLLAALALTYSTKREEPVKRRWTWICGQVIMVAVIGFATWHFWFKDGNFHKEVQMANLIDRCDWEGVLAVERAITDEPTRMMVLNQRLALFRLGRAGDELYNYRDGSKQPATSQQMRMVQMGGKNIYLHYGLVNYCYRWCLEDGVENGWRVEYLKDLVRSALINGELVAAQKYIDLLKQTRYHAEWAEHYEQFLAHPEKIKDDPELGPIKELVYPHDILASDQSLIELFLLNTLSNRLTDSPKMSELVLLSAMQLKNIQAFWPAFNQYARLHLNKPMPRHFQEAAYLYGHLEHDVDISRMPFSPEVRKSYEEFMKLANQCRGMSEERMKDVFALRFGNTFYYNYFLMRNMKTY